MKKNNIENTPGLLAYIQQGSDLDFKPESLFTLDQNQLQIKSYSEFLTLDMDNKIRWAGPNMHIPNSTEFEVYFFIRSSDLKRVFKLFKCQYKKHHES